MVQTLPIRVRLFTATIVLTRWRFRSPAPSVRGVDHTYSVTELSQAIGRVLSRAFVDEVWVEGEIRDLTRARNGHVYFTLVDPSAAAEQAPVLPVTLFASDRVAVNRVLVRSGAMRMSDGVHVRIRGRIGHYAPRAAVQLRMTWIDTDYTMGKLAAERRALLEKLAAERLLERNAALPLPLVPLRIGLVTSVGSAAHADFIDELGVGSYAFTVLVADARTQGPLAAETIVAALRTLSSHRPDVVALVRGGGAQTDLAAFDDEGLAVAIATAGFPVFTGIGHEIDSSVADHVAARSLKTPTACAQEIVAMVRGFEQALRTTAQRVGVAGAAGAVRAGHLMEGRSVRLAASARLHIARHERHVAAATDVVARRTAEAVAAALTRTTQAAAHLHGGVRHHVGRADGDLAAAERRLVRGSTRGVAAAGRRLDGLAAVYRSHDPRRLLERGWSLTYGPDDALVRAPDDVATGDRLRTRTAGGDIGSVVERGGTGRGG